jgi:hypothetical protein
MGKFLKVATGEATSPCAIPYSLSSAAMIEPLPPMRGLLTGLAMATATLASLGIPDEIWRRRALAGVLLLGLGLASHARLEGAGDSATIPSAAAAITLGITVLGALITVAVLIVTLAQRQGSVMARWWVRLAGMVAVAVGVGPLLPLGTRGGWPIVFATVVGLALAGALAVWLGQRLALSGVVRRLDKPLLAAGTAGPPDAVRHAWASRLLMLHIVAVIVALGALHLHALMGAVTISALAGVMVERWTGRTGRMPVVLPLVVLVLAGLWFFLARVAGAMPLGLLALRDAPYSLAFETLVSLPLALAAWALLGLWPFHNLSRGPLTGLLGAAILVKLVAPVLPHGFAHWQPLLYPLAVLAAWHAAAVDRDEETLAALGALGLLSGDLVAGWAGTGLVTVGALFGATHRIAGHGVVLNQRGRITARLAVVGAAVLVVPVLAGALDAEVLYSVLTVSGVVVGLWLREVRSEK